jgi:hypothetical protein
LKYIPLPPPSSHRWGEGEGEGELEVVFRKWTEQVKKKGPCLSTIKIVRFVEKLLIGSNGTKGVMY